MEAGVEGDYQVKESHGVRPSKREQGSWQVLLLASAGRRMVRRKRVPPAHGAGPEKPLRYSPPGSWAEASIRQELRRRGKTGMWQPDFKGKWRNQPQPVGNELDLHRRALTSFHTLLHLSKEKTPDVCKATRALWVNSSGLPLLNNEASDNCAAKWIQSSRGQRLGPDSESRKLPFPDCAAALKIAWLKCQGLLVCKLRALAMVRDCSEVCRHPGTWMACLGSRTQCWHPGFLFPALACLA